MTPKTDSNRTADVLKSSPSTSPPPRTRWLSVLRIVFALLSLASGTVAVRAAIGIRQAATADQRATDFLGRLIADVLAPFGEALLWAVVVMSGSACVGFLAGAIAMHVRLRAVRGKAAGSRVM